MKKILLLFVLVFAVASMTLGQTVQIRGTVTDSEDGLGIPEAVVSIKGTTLGTSTDSNGNYTLKVPAGSGVLLVSYVGKKRVEIEIEGKTVINVTLESETQLLDELVVVGYGVQNKRDVSGSIATVKGDEIRTTPIQSFDQALQGKATGVNITTPNGVLNNPPVIRIRGFNSISSSSYPLIVVDGVAIFTGDVSSTNTSANALSDINPSDIASMEILKDASATAIYGSRAANGVILITTKRGSGTKTKVTYDGYVGITQPYRLFDVLNSKQYLAQKNLALRNYYTDAGGNPDAPGSSYFSLISDPDGPEGNYVDTKWSDYVYRTGLQQNHAVTVSGSTPSTSYFLSVGYTDQKGIIKKNTFERKNVRLNIDHKLNKYITLGASFTYVNSFSRAPNTGSLSGQAFSTGGVARLAFVNSPLIGPYNFDGTYNLNGQYIGNMGTTQPSTLLGFYNPVAIIDLDKYTSETDRILGNLSASFVPFKGLTLKTIYGLDNLGVESISFYNPLTGDGYSGGEATNYYNRLNRWTWTNTLDYQTTINEKFNLRLLVGEEEQYTDNNSWYGDKTDVADPFFTTYQGSWKTASLGGGGQGENYFISFFSRLNFDYNKKYYFELSARRDGFSGLSSGNKYGTFGGTSLMWNLSNENFIKSSRIGDIFSGIRLKASYGRVGNISGVADYSSLFLYSSSIYGSEATLYFSQAGNSDLKWEASNKFDAGLSFGILKDRIQINLSYYYNNVNDLILNTPQSPSKGIPGNTIPENIGSMLNTGIEASVTSYNINRKEFQWNTTLNFSTLKNEVTSLAPGVNEVIGYTSGLETTNKTVVGHPLGMIYGVESHGVDPETGRRIFVNGNGDEILYTHIVQSGQNKWTYRESGEAASAVNISNSGKLLGSAIPKVYGGIDNNIIYKKFDASLSLTYALDFYLYNGSKAGLRDQRFWNNTVDVYENSWKQSGDITDIPRPVYSDNVSNGSTMVMSQNVERGDYLKVKSVSAGYTFNTFPAKLNIEKVRIYAQVFNAYVFTKYTGSDPEVSSNGNSNLSPGVDRNSAPQARTYTLGVNVTF